MSSVALAWLLGCAAVAVWAIVVAVLWHSDTAPAPRRVVHPVLPRASLRILFVDVTDRGYVIDGLLDLEGSRVGVPTTWTLEPPHSELFSTATLNLLERWSDDGIDVMMDLSKLRGAHPSIALSREDSLVRLPVIGLPPVSGDDHFAHP
jgi:hypothetical protein